MNKITALGAKQISSNLGEIQRENHFELVFSFPAESEFASVWKDKIGNRSFSWFVKTINLPEETTEVMTYTHGNSKVKFAGPTSFNETSMDIIDSIDVDTEAILVAWRQAVYNVNLDLTGQKKNYQATMMVYEYSPDGAVSRTWEFKGVWPSQVNYGSLNAESTDFKTISVTLVYDYARRIID